MSEPAREYFYHVDREGVLRHDGTVLDDERFLRFFFRRLRRNETGRHESYPFVSMCGPEANYVACDETVIVFRRRTAEGELEYAAGLTVPFDPAGLRVSGDGRLYHVAPVGEVGLLRTALAMELSQHIEERDGSYVYATAEGAWPIAAL